MLNVSSERLLLQREHEVSERFGVTRSPSAVLVTTNAKVGSEPAEGASQIAELVHRIVSSGSAANRSSHPALPPLASASTLPAVASSTIAAVDLIDLDGKVVKMATLYARQRFIVFWNPECGYCQKMLPQLRELALLDSRDAQQLMILSTGSIERNREMGLRSPVLLDHAFRVGSALGVQGTPSAMVIGVGGTVLGPVAIGASQILALASSTLRASSDPVQLVGA